MLTFTYCAHNTYKQKHLKKSNDNVLNCDFFSTIFYYYYLKFFFKHCFHTKAIKKSFYFLRVKRRIKGRERASELAAPWVRATCRASSSSPRSPRDKEKSLISLLRVHRSGCDVTRPTHPHAHQLLRRVARRAAPQPAGAWMETPPTHRKNADTQAFLRDTIFSWKIFMSGGFQVFCYVSEILIWSHSFIMSKSFLKLQYKLV